MNRRQLLASLAALPFAGALFWDAQAGEPFEHATILGHIDTELAAIEERGEEAVRVYMTQQARDEWVSVVRLAGAPLEPLPPYSSHHSWRPNWSEVFHRRIPVEVQDGPFADHSRFNRDRVDAIAWNSQGFAIATRPCPAEWVHSPSGVAVLTVRRRGTA